ncbi:MAG: hypothetical protein PHE02_10805 [Lachnospiraceae bacterium]|nr:hypothetical protein [Lachnospiraceae bacterium]
MDERTVETQQRKQNVREKEEGSKPLTDSEKLDLLIDGFVMMHKRFDEIDVRFEQIDRRFEQIDEHFEQIDRRFEQIDERFEQIDRRFEQIDERFEQIDRRFEQIDERFEQIDRRFEQIDERFEQIDQRFEYNFMYFENRFNTLNDRIKDIAFILENETFPNIKRVAEGHLDLNRKIEELQKIDTEKELFFLRINHVESEVNRLKEKIS